MKVWKITDKGSVRQDNQDSCDVRENMAGRYTVCVVCDGMGGTAGGQLASSTAIDVYLEILEELLTGDQSPDEIQAASAAAITAANHAVVAKAACTPGCSNMGTTLVSAIVDGETAYISNVGDSRAYHIAPAGITQISRDHSWVASMVERGDLTEQEARHHPKRNLITRALGPDDEVEGDHFICPLKAGEYLLLCTDGLVNTVEDSEIYYSVIHGDVNDEYLNREQSDDECLSRLLHISKSRGAPDNVTIILARQ